MPELAEVEYYRRQWNCGLGGKILEVRLHPGKRVFRKVRVNRLESSLPGAVLLGSAAHGKQMLFRFSKGIWIGIHLGMTGKLRAEPPEFAPGKHDHFTLRQRQRTLVFSDARLFGRVSFHEGQNAPAWWLKLPPALNSKEFTPGAMERFLQRHCRLAIKAALLRQEAFPGIGNWMADEILWRARTHPETPSGEFRGDQILRLWQQVSFVCRGAMKHVSQDFSDPPKGWLFRERWRSDGQCPLHRTRLRRATIGGRTTVWCPKCQPSTKSGPG